MKKIAIACALVLMFLVFSSCGCEHQWADATCTTPKTCALCGVTEGEIAAHTWAISNCVSPQTCTVCGKTERERSSMHAYENGTCTLCGRKASVFDGKSVAQAAIAAFCASEHPLANGYDGEASDTLRAEYEAWFSSSFGVDAKIAFMATYGMDDLFIWVFESGSDAAEIASILEQESMPVYRKNTVLLYGEADDVQLFSQYLA